mmetsp:Transcript_20610/g.31512  ORF Transcript_20610/g.31512 Transcript_20610/m.31512 type:complete len:93 (-) Transcript_20610:799-1077(-)
MDLSSTKVIFERPSTSAMDALMEHSDNDNDDDEDMTPLDGVPLHMNTNKHLTLEKKTASILLLQSTKNIRTRLPAHALVKHPYSERRRRRQQ